MEFEQTAAGPSPSGFLNLLGEPLDWQHAIYPSRWRLMGREVTYDWVGENGAGQDSAFDNQMEAGLSFHLAIK